MYKLIAIDIDGTLLNSKSELTERTIEVLKKASEKGIYIVLTSGRMSSVVNDFCKKIGADKYLIAENGASIVDMQNGEIIYKRYIPKNIVLDIVDICEENNIYYMVYTNKELIVKNLKHMALFFYKQNYNPNARLETHIAGRSYIESLEDDFTKIMICDEDRSVYNSIVNKLNKIESIDVTTIPHVSTKVLNVGTEQTTISYIYADIAAKNTNKWSAIEVLMNMLDIKSEEVIAIGDNINDIQMIKNAGLGVVMSNGSPVVKEIAKEIAPSNDEDGVAYIVEKNTLCD
ncbi:MAG: HAD family phosphatase [Clostridia bacterium]|nr:HAD family phosphatase [Clostridia bacterium]